MGGVHALVGLRLRVGLVIEPRDGGVSVKDPVTGRVFGFDEPQAAVLDALDGHRGPKAIALDVFGDSEAETHVAQLLERLQRLGLVGQFRLDPQDIGHGQAKELRRRAAELRDRRVADSVRWAASEMPFYRDRIGARADHVRGMADLAALPMTTKRDVRDQFPHGLIAKGHDFSELLARGEIQIETSSGSTGDRLESFSTLSESQPYVLFCRHPAMRAAGQPENVRMAFFTTPICSGAVCHRGSPYEERVIDDGRQLVLHSSERIMRLRKVELDQIVEELQRFAPDVLQIDPVYGVALVRALQRNDLPIPKVSGIFSTYEFMSCIHRDILTEAFGVPIYQLHGASEINGFASFTCEHGRFHGFEDSHVFEIVSGGKPTRSGEWGELVVTMVRGPYSRLIRYRLGDLATPVEECGCQFDDLNAFELEGRIQDLVFTTAGDPVSSRQVDSLFEGLGWLDFYQFLQRDRQRYELLGVPRDGVDATTDERIFAERVRERFGADAQLRVGYVRELPVNPSLKYPPTLNRSARSWRPND